MINHTLHKIISHLQTTYHCHSVILYGSHARNTAEETSDIDILAIRETGELLRDTTIFDNKYLDAFIYSEIEINEPDESFLRIKDSKVLLQKNDLGDQLLTKIHKLFLSGPKKLPDWEKEVIVHWSHKMFNRAQVLDIEANYRRHWLLYDLLIAYFHLRDMWYMGSKESFTWLKMNDFVTYEAFEKALLDNASLAEIKNCLDRVIAYV